MANDPTVPCRFCADRVGGRWSAPRQRKFCSGRCRVAWWRLTRGCADANLAEMEWLDRQEAVEEARLAAVHDGGAAE